MQLVLSEYVLLEGSEEVGCSKLCLSTVDAMTRGLMICKHYSNIKVDQIWILFSRNLQPE